MSVEVENIRKDVRMRVETDSMMSSAWILVYILPIIFALVWIAVFIAALLSTIARFPTTPPPPPSGEPITTIQTAPIFASIALLYGFVIIFFIANIILIYKLVRRRNSHFKRQIFLFEDVMAAVKAMATRKGVDVEVGLASGERTVREAKAEETEKNAMLWAILSVVTGLATWYVWYFLMKDFYKHERVEDAFWEDVSKTMDKLGVKFSVPRRMETLPDRSFVLYLILTIVTFGFFGIYWVYVLLKDPNQHFRYHIQIEDQLLTTLESVAVT